MPGDRRAQGTDRGRRRGEEVALRLGAVSASRGCHELPAREGSPLRIPESASHCPHLDFEPQASGTARLDKVLLFEATQSSVPRCGSPRKPMQVLRSDRMRDIWEVSRT